jgi:hypothetical protein
MSSILALSVSDKIEQYGAYAGFASVLGLAVLSLLYFAQAREVKRLREWAGRAPERAVDQQERAVAAAQQQRVVAQPQRPAAPAAQPGQPVAPGARPAAATPAGQAAAVPGATAAAAATAAGAATATPGAPPAPPSPNGPAGQPTTVQPAAAANGAAAGPATPPPPAPRPGQPLRVPADAAGPARSSLPPEPEDEGRSRLAVFGAIGAIAVVLVVGVVLVTGLFGGDDGAKQPDNRIGTPGETTAQASQTATTKKKGTQPTAAPQPGTYVVAVLNGTTVPGLARGVANRLTNAKYKIGNVTNAATQDRSQTQVEFAPGHRAEADSVAKAIDVGSDAIIPLTAGSKTIAGDQATVVVTVGADQNQSPQAQTTTP